MAKLHFVKKAAKTYRGTGIKKGDEYWFYFTMRPRNGGSKDRGKRILCRTKPRRSSYATTSDFVGRMMDAEDDLAELLANGFENETITGALGAIAEQVRELGDETQSKLDGVSDAFPNGCPTIDLLESRVQSCETIADEIEYAAQEITDESTAEEIEQLISGISWEYE